MYPVPASNPKLVWCVLKVNLVEFRLQQLLVWQLRLVLGYEGRG
jgi:hypothetical protein